MRKATIAVLTAATLAVGGAYYGLEIGRAHV